MQNSQERTCTLVSCQSATYNFTEKETSAYMFFVNFCKIFWEHLCYDKPPANWFWQSILWKMTNRHSYYNKAISWSRQLFQRTDIVRESINLITIGRKLILNLIVILNSFTDIFFLKYVTKIFHFPYYFQKNIWECFKVDLSVVVPVYFIKDFGKQATEAEVLKCISKNSLSEKLLKF